MTTTTREGLRPLMISTRPISPDGLTTVPLGRTHDLRIIRRPHDGSFVIPGDPIVHPLMTRFLAELTRLAPAELTAGAAFMRCLPPGPTTANETHRDRDNRATNFVCMVTGEDDELSRQHEFFADDDPWEQQPIIVANGHLIGFTKHLHRRPTRPAGTGPRVFLSASLWHSASDVPPLPTTAEPYTCHGTPVAEMAGAR